MPELTLERVSEGQYALAGIGTLRNLSRYGAEIEAQGVAWTLRRAGLLSGQLIHAVERSSDTRVASYRPSGFLGGIYRGAIEHSEREFEWRENRRLGVEFTLTEGGVLLAHFVARTEPRPVVASVDDLSRVEPLVLLFGCHLAKQLVEVGKFAPMTGGGAASG